MFALLHFKFLDVLSMLVPAVKPSRRGYRQYVDLLLYFDFYCEDDLNWFDIVKRLNIDVPIFLLMGG